MQKLPKGYYAIQADFENAAKDCFTYKGVCYEVEEGVNLFATAPEADAAATEIPEVVLEGLDYERFEAPVLLFSVGTHRIDDLNPTASRILLGEKAGVNPNLAPTVPGEMPALNPARAEREQESLLYGGNARGNIRPQEGCAPLLLLDGFYNHKARFFDRRILEDLECLAIFRNIVYVGPWGKLVHLFSGCRPGHNVQREVRFENIRLDGYDDMTYGGIFMYMHTKKATFDNVVYNDTAKLFGFTDLGLTTVNVPVNAECAEITIKNSYFGNMRGEHGICVNLRQAPDRAFSLTVENTTFHNAALQGESPLQVCLTNERCSLTLRDCRFTDTRGGKAAVTVYGEGESITLEGCTLTGFAGEVDRQPLLITEAPAYIENHATDWRTETEDAHTVIGTEQADFFALDACYAGCKPYRGDQHVHSASGGRSDGKYPLAGWVEKMDEVGLDFAAIVDHHQMRGFFLPEWNEERFIMGSEPGSGLLPPHNCGATSSFHYNMLVPHRYGLAMVLTNFPEFEFHGDELTGSFGYPKFTKERLLQLNDYMRSIGGMLVHAHPKVLMASEDPLDYYFGEHSFIETVIGTYSSTGSFRTHDLWVDLLNLGKHVYASVGSDTHTDVRNTAVATAYLKERHARSFFEAMRRGNYTAGAVGIKMCIDGNPMGAELAFREGMRLTLRVGDFFGAALKKNTAYELRVYTDKGLAYASRFNGNEPQALALAVQPRRYYRAEVLDLTHNCRIAAGNPIWLDKNTNDN